MFAGTSSVRSISLTQIRRAIAQPGPSTSGPALFFRPLSSSWCSSSRCRRTLHIEVDVGCFGETGVGIRSWT